MATDSYAPPTTAAVLGSASGSGPAPGTDPATGAERKRERPFTLGFHSRVSFPSSHEAEGLRDGIELFRVAEQLGYDTGWVYHRHFDNYLSAPLVFLPVVAQHTARIGLGTSIIGIRYESPILLAEAAATADLLSDGRLELGLGTGIGGFETIFEQGPNDGGEQSRIRLERFLAGIRDKEIGTVDENSLLPAGLPVKVTPQSAGLTDRIWYATGDEAGAARIGREGLRLSTSTILTGDFPDYGAAQAHLIESYRDAYTGTKPPRVSVSRSILPATSPETARLYAAYDEERRTQGPAASRPAGALAAPANTGAGRITMSGSLHGEPEAIVEALANDPAVALADEFVAFLPPAFGLAENLRLIEDIVETIAKPLGWHPAEAAPGTSETTAVGS